MAKVLQSDAAEAEYSSTLECPSNEFSLGLKPTELEALLERLCSCSTRRVNPSRRALQRERCPRRITAQWCRLGQRGVGGERVETRFG